MDVEMAEVVGEKDTQPTQQDPRHVFFRAFSGKFKHALGLWFETCLIHRILYRFLWCFCSLFHMGWTSVWSKDSLSPDTSGIETEPLEPAAQETKLSEDVAGVEDISDHHEFELSDADLEGLFSTRMFDDTDDTQPLAAQDPYSMVESPVQAPQVT